MIDMITHNVFISTDANMNFIAHAEITSSLALTDRRSWGFFLRSAAWQRSHEPGLG